MIVNHSSSCSISNYLLSTTKALDQLLELKIRYFLYLLNMTFFQKQYCDTHRICHFLSSKHLTLHAMNSYIETTALIWFSIIYYFRTPIYFCYIQQLPPFIIPKMSWKNPEKNLEIKVRWTTSDYLILCSNVSLQV